ncbi:hypothetical protein BBJ29_006496 [Phytophthora kernoviae]|uniref:Cilia- and flagella-associated protein 43 n=1 Tax=Phytophthora kernoviae TaxID=325452 RepID=A0A3F2RUE6_9STRA|nr:hypothetical protein BBJ29_006496 [Phytophthora kernoviae]RLN64444.1 hypothetical protein BBP00_00003449 [Phytophthora kernoviae]
MSVDATVRHIFGYDGSAGDAPPLQLADEQTLVYVCGHTLNFTSTVTREQQFFVQPQPRKIVAFDINWKTATFAVAAREPEATIALYSHPDKRLKVKLELPKSKGSAQDEVFEYSLIKFSRCGRRLLSIRSDKEAATGDNKSEEPRAPLVCVWDLETQTPVPGCERSHVFGPARFASFDPANVDQFVVGGDNGLQVWKMYTGKTAASSLLRPEAVTLPRLESNGGQPTNPVEVVEWEERRKQFCCHAWLPESQLLVANQAGDLFLVDTIEAKIVQQIMTAARPDRCPIVGIVVTIEIALVAYSDGALAWLQMDNWELLNTGFLPPSSIVTVMAPTPTYAKAYVGTRDGKIFEVRTSVLQDDDDDIENEEDAGLFYSARYQAPPQEDSSAGSAGGRRDVSPSSALQIVPKVVAFGEAVLPMCSRLRFLGSTLSSMMIATSPSRPELTLLKYRDVLRESTEEISILSKVLTKRAHARGISAVALFPRALEEGVELLVTGGMDGTITLWTLTLLSVVNSRRQPRMSADGERESKESASAQNGDLDEMQATKKRTLVAHAGPVTTLRFIFQSGGTNYESGAGVSIQLISTGVDGCAFLMDVRLSAELLGDTMGSSGLKSSVITMNPLFMNVVSSAKYDDVFQPEREQECTPFLEARAHAEATTARDRFDRGKDGTRIKLRELEGRLKIILAENELLPEGERLEREEFVLNVAWRDTLLSEHATRSQRVREGIARDLARMAIVRERMKREFWDVAEVPGWVLNAGSLHPNPQQAASGADSAVSVDASDYATQPSFHFMYHPASVHTRKQSHVQIHLLSSYSRALQSAFNAEFQDLVRQKENTMEQIEAKNARILEITVELNSGGSVADLFQPQWTPEERADSITKVAPEEMTQRPYETAERRKQREREAQETAEREMARKKDDVGGRALIDMMDGTLEVKKDPLAAQDLVKEPWMLTTPPEEMTAEQKKLVAQFEAAQTKFVEEREKYRKSLDLELRKTRGEVIDLCRAFDEKIRALRDRYMATRRAVLAQELYELRLSEELMSREHLELGTQRLEDEMRTFQETEAKAQAESDRFTTQLEACREDWQRAADEDKILEKSFVRELEEMVQSSGSAGSSLENIPTASTGQLESPEFTKHLVELYRKRKPDDLVRDGAPGFNQGNSSMKRTGSSVNKTTAKQQMLAEGAAGDGSGRNLVTTTPQSLRKTPSSSNEVGPEGNLDPFQYLDSKQQDPIRREASSGQALTVMPLDYMADRPDGALIEDRVWRALNALRAKKILSEHAVKEKAELLALAKTVSDELDTKLSELHRQHRHQQREQESLAHRRTALSESAPLLVRIKQGQDEAPVGGNGDDALFVARTSVEALNDVIQLHGKDQVGILGRIKDFRKSINVMEWEHALLELQARDMDERYTDIQLLRVTKDLQELFHTGDTSHKQKREAAMLEAKLTHLSKHQHITLLKLERTGNQLERQLRERERENRNFQQQVAQLATQVQIREDILTSRTSAAIRQQTAEGGAVRGNAARLKAISVRRKLVDLAKAQTDEIEYLRLELDKMRRRTFPSFAHAREYHDVD